MLLLKRLFLALPLLLMMASCSEDFNVAAPYKSVTLVYGLINIGDTAHYIRIQKAFLDENKSALNMAQEADSNFFGSLSVHLKELSSAGVLLKDTILPRVDLNNEGYKKESGVFFNAPNYAYKSKMKLVPGNAYRLVITNTVTGEVDSAESPIIDNQRTTQGIVVTQFNNSYVLSFPGIHPDDEYRLNTVYVPANSKMYEGIIRFHWVNRVGGVQTDDSVEWRFASTTWDGITPGITLKTNQRAFYQFLKDAIGPAPSNMTRHLDSADLIFWAGSNDLYNYQTINNVQGGITADQIKPLYTNMKGNNVFGIFTCRARAEFRNIGISQPSLDTLINSSVTRSLGFVGRSDH